MEIKGVAEWRKRLSRKGPFYLYAKTPYDYVINRSDGSVFERHGTRYHLIWNDGLKTKIGSVHDHMSTRYGIATKAAANGDRMLDVWNGGAINEPEFKMMMEVRNGVSSLPKFDLSTLVGLSV